MQRIKSGIYELKEELGALKGKEEEERKIVGDLLEPSDFVVLVVPIDSAAPKGTPDFATAADDSRYSRCGCICNRCERNGTYKNISFTWKKAKDGYYR